MPGAEEHGERVPETVSGAEVSVASVLGLTQMLQGQSENLLHLSDKQKP